MSSCYKNFGRWCGTCVSEAKIGEQGYCGPNQTDSSHDEKNSETPWIYPNSTNWGLCDPKCRENRGAKENLLQVSSYQYTVRP